MTFANNGIIDTPSSHTVDRTVEKLKNILQDRGSTCLRWLTIAGRQKRWG